MDMNAARVGQRVATNTPIDIYPLGVWPVGTSGVITEISRINGQQVAYVKLDEHFACLNEWDNCLIAWADADEANSDARIAAFDSL